MSDEISLPIAMMRQVAQQIMSDTDTLGSETSSRIQHMHNSNSSLPGSMQGAFSNLLEPLQRNLSQVLTLRHSIGQTLSEAADAALATEEAIDTSMIAR